MIQTLRMNLSLKPNTLDASCPDSVAIDFCRFLLATASRYSAFSWEVEA